MNRKMNLVEKVEKYFALYKKIFGIFEKLIIKNWFMI
jgi:hypothetical protein